MNTKYHNSKTRKLSWPTGPGVWWYRSVAVYGPGSIWNGRRIRKKCQTRHSKGRWMVVDVEKVSEFEVSYYYRPRHYRMIATRPPEYPWLRHQWVKAVEPR